MAKTGRLPPAGVTTVKPKVSTRARKRQAPRKVAVSKPAREVLSTKARGAGDSLSPRTVVQAFTKLNQALSSCDLASTGPQKASDVLGRWSK